MGGGLRDMYESWREELKVCLAHAEAVIDFGDDEVRQGLVACNGSRIDRFDRAIYRDWAEPSMFL